MTMVKIKASANQLLGPLQQVTGIVERRHTLPILSNVLVQAHGGRVDFIATDLEVQITAGATVEQASEGSITVAARKLHDILRSLADDAEVALEAKEGRMVVRAGKSRFNLQTLASADFPRMADAKDASRTLTLPQRALKHALGLVQFAMAVQDIRYYLNGVLFSVDGNTLRVVATDGHRLSFAAEKLESSHEAVEAILPRKTVLELIKLLGDGDEPVSLAIGANQARFSFGGIEIISKIVEGKFPDYAKVIPTGHRNQVELDRSTLSQSLNRAAILSNEKIRGVRMVFTKDALSIICTNNDQEEAEESLAIAYDGDPIDIGFNISYLLDALNHVDADKVSLAMGDANSSALLQMPGNDDFKYVVMPMRI
jgi:DNA polymerase-3 subunit beta